jgi:hypothetical protein
MVEQEKNGALRTEAPDDAELKSASPESEPPADQKPEEPAHLNSLAQKRGRMVSAGVLTAVIVSAVAVVVAGIFGLTSTWLKVCPTELPVNDPARYLSDQLTKEQGGPQPLGISGKIAEQTRLKGLEPSQVESGTETVKGK